MGVQELRGVGVGCINEGTCTTLRMCVAHVRHCCPVSMMMRSSWAGDALDPPLWKIPDRALSLSLSRALPPSLSLSVSLSYLCLYECM
jgi:hypothetical protein